MGTWHIYARNMFLSTFFLTTYPICTQVECVYIQYCFVFGRGPTGMGPVAKNFFEEKEGGDATTPLSKYKKERRAKAECACFEVH